MSRAIEGSCAYRESPGQSVKFVSRWPEIARSSTATPDGKRGLPPEDQLSVESGSTCARSSFHASSCSSELFAAADGAAELYSPRTATPKEPVLKPSECAPMIALSTPP